MSSQPPQHALQNPISGTTIDTSAPALGLSPDNLSDPTVQELSPTSAKDSTDHKGVVKRAVESTVSKLAASASLSGLPGVKKSNSSRRSSGSKRLFSISRKGKHRNDDTTETGSGPEDDSSNEKPSPTKEPGSTSPRSPELSGSPLGDDSPFIRPRSPSPAPANATTRPTVETFRGFGSMRAGTQTLIQALQAMPWTDEPEGDDDVIEGISGMSDSPESSEEERNERLLASSIHTIHRPVARQRRRDTPLSPSTSHAKAPSGGYFPTIQSSDDEDDNAASDEDEDFEATPIGSMAARRKEYPANAQDTVVAGKPGLISTHHKNERLARIQRMSRTASLATVRLKRRAKLAEKLKDIFGLSAIEEVVAELPCWLLRSILLQGYMYLTNSHLCFFAHMPAREDQVLKSGSLNKKTQRTKRWVKHWFVLKNDVLSWYQSSSDPYFPHGVIDLRYAISCETVQEKGFRIRTNQKVVTLMADSSPSREEWVKAVRKVIFKAQNLGDSVKIAIPYTVITDVEKSSAMDFSETIEVKVSEKDDASTDSYFFAYFHNISLALDQIRDAVRTYKPTTYVSGAIEEVVHDTTTHKVSSPTAERLTPSIDGHRSSYSSKLASLLRFSSDSTVAHPTGVRTAPDSTNPSRTALSPSLSGTSLPPHAIHTATSVSANDVGTIRPSDSYHTYPPAPSPVNISPVQSRESIISSWSVPVPSWLKVPSKRVFSSSFGPSSSATEQGVQEVVSPLTPSLALPLNNAGNGSTELGYSVLETKDAAEPEMIEKFRTAFAFDEKEPLLGYFPGYLFRLLPTPGRLYVSTNFFCFKSSGPLATRTRMILPIRDILALENSKAYRFGHQGLVIIIKGHEELFFEFSSLERRSAFYNLLQRQMEDIRSRPVSGDVPKISEEKRDALVLEELEPSSILSDEEPRPPPETLTDSLPAVMFTSKSSTFLTFKPQKSLRFTFLTIGTRGDVQPYIALAKGLIADGHSCKIATHGEFKDWIESHGIEFGYVGGDPAELMRLCVENGMFTVSFLKEGVQKFRSWIDDLLKTAWEACQGTDVLIESPVAMGGIHIAEALKIPYFRAFTMTWTRTRAYPHAFAVPERKMGGGYNYMTYVMFDQVFWRGTAGQINRWRKHMLGLPSTSLDKLEPHKVPFLYNFSPTVVPPPLDWPEWIRVTGYWFLDDADGGSKKTWSPPDGIVEFIDKAHNSGRKVVYIGFGSIVVSDPDAMTRCVVEAIVKSGVHAILSKGWSDRLHVKKSTDVFEPEIPLPPQIYPIQSIPHDWLFKRIDAACHHGGAGTTGASLRAGIPTIIKPFFGDQFFWADRVEALGIGSGVRKLTVEHLTEALVYATSDAKQIARAKLVGEQIRSENGVATAVEAIYRDLEYARSLIKPGRSDDSSTSDEDVKSPNEKQRKRRSSQSTPDRLHSSDSNHGAPSEDWSVISDQESSRVSASLDRSPSSKRNSLAAAVMSVLPTSKPRNSTP